LVHLLSYALAQSLVSQHGGINGVWAELRRARRCEEIAKRAECKATPGCIYDTARGCYTGKA
jgi:hypothetical protein